MCVAGAWEYNRTRALKRISVSECVACSHVHTRIGGSQNFSYILFFTNFQFSCSVMSDTSRPHGPQHARPPCPSPTPGVYSNSYPLNRWCHPTISCSVIPLSSHLQTFSASESFQMSQLFTSGDQRIGVSASTSVLPVNTQDWFPLGCIGWISLQSKGPSIVFSNTTVQSILWCTAFFIVQLSHPNMTTGKTIALTRWTLLAK